MDLMTANTVPIRPVTMVQKRRVLHDGLADNDNDLANSDDLTYADQACICYPCENFCGFPEHGGIFSTRATELESQMPASMPSLLAPLAAESNVISTAKTGLSRGVIAELIVGLSKLRAVFLA
jgi:hypothetical protein